MYLGLEMIFFLRSRESSLLLSLFMSIPLCYLMTCAVSIFIYLFPFYDLVSLETVDS